MSKLSKFLLSHGTLTKVNPSGSSYYSIKDQKIRVSDHLTGLNPDSAINILLPQGTKTQYIVVLLGQLYIYNSFTELRVFLENYIILCKAFSQKKNMLENKKIKEQHDTIVQLNNKINKLSQADSKKEISFKDASLNSLTPAQKIVVVNFIQTNKQNKK